MKFRRTTLTLSFVSLTLIACHGPGEHHDHGDDASPLANDAGEQGGDENESEMAFGDLPVGVLEAAMRAVADFVPTSAEYEPDEDPPVYEIEGTANGVVYEIEVTGMAEVVEIEREDEDDD